MNYKKVVFNICVAISWDVCNMMGNGMVAYKGSLRIHNIPIDTSRLMGFVVERAVNRLDHLWPS